MIAWVLRVKLPAPKRDVVIFFGAAPAVYAAIFGPVLQSDPPYCFYHFTKRKANLQAIDIFFLGENRSIFSLLHFHIRYGDTTKDLFEIILPQKSAGGM